MEKTNSKKGFASSIGFILAAAGSAVGLGNLWGFPYKTSANGGAAFVLVYIVCVIIIGAIAMIAEIYLGKRAQANTVSVYKKANKNLGWVGLVVMTIPFLITTYYSVLGGWTLKFAISPFQPITEATNANAFGAFISSPFEPIFYTLIFMIISAFIIVAGIKGGIESASKVLMPILFLILVSIVIVALSLGEGVKEGLAYYLKPDFSALGFKGILAAMGQAFFSLSLGMGAMICYGSYTGNEIKVGNSVLMICIFDSLVALLAGLAIFPSVYHYIAVNGANASELGMGGVGLMFQTLPIVFESLGLFGQILSFFFFAMVAIAATTSVISLLEVVAQFVIQKFGIKRRKATLIICLIALVISIPVAWSVGGAFSGAITIFGFDMLTFFDEATNTVLMPLGAFAATLTVGWFVGEKKTIKDWFNPKTLLNTMHEEGISLGAFDIIFAFMVKYVTPLLIIFLDIAGIITAIIGNANYIYVVAFALLIVAICVGIYFAFFKNTNTGSNENEVE